MALLDTDINDLVTGTLKALGRLKFNQIATTIQNYEVMGRIMKKDKVQFDDGIGIQRTIMTSQSGSAKSVGLFETDTLNVADVLQTMNIPWRHATANYAYERRELIMNKGESRIVDLLKVRRADAMISLAELMETLFWSKPVDSTDKVNPFGAPYWIVKNTTQGFNGGNPSGFTAGAGNLDSTVYTTWANWTDQYVNVTKADLISKMRIAYRKIQFKSPVDIPDYREGKGDQYRLYVNEPTIRQFEDLGEAQNENLGRDIATMDDTIAFRRNPIVYVPKLDADTTNPVYFINYAWFYPVFLQGDYLRETEPTKSAQQHNVWVVHVDLTWNVLCTDRRQLAVITL